MKILVINGSPKGRYSFTLQTCRFLEKHFNNITFHYVDAGQRIHTFEKDFTEAKAEIEWADMLIFTYPVYTFSIPCQLYRFIELMQESGVSVKEKWATQVTTSKHFYDVTAHKLIEEIASDMGMRVIRGLSADMDDLPTEKGQNDAIEWMKMVVWETEGRQLVDVSDKSIIVVADIAEGDDELREKVEQFRHKIQCEVEVINIREYPFQGGCMSCFSCASTGKCVYKDGFDEYLRNHIHRHDAIVYAFRIQNHSMGSRFKMYDDRQFCNGHRTVTMGTPFAYIIAGEYDKEPNLRMLVEARAEVGGNLLAGVWYEGEADAMVARLSYAMANRLMLPQNFYGVGGMKIFRDLIYIMRGLTRADHKFFKEHGQYDFPQKQWRKSLMMYLVAPLMTNKKLRAKMGAKINEGMMKPYYEVIEKEEKR